MIATDRYNGTFRFGRRYPLSKRLCLGEPRPDQAGIPLVIVGLSGGDCPEQGFAHLDGLPRTRMDHQAHRVIQAEFPFMSIEKDSEVRQFAGVRAQPHGQFAVRLVRQLSKGALDVHLDPGPLDRIAIGFVRCLLDHPGPDLLRVGDAPRGDHSDRFQRRQPRPEMLGRFLPNAHLFVGPGIEAVRQVGPLQLPIAEIGVEFPDRAHHVAAMFTMPGALIRVPGEGSDLGLAVGIIDPAPLTGLGLRDLEIPSIADHRARAVIYDDMDVMVAAVIMGVGCVDHHFVHETLRLERPAKMLHHPDAPGGIESLGQFGLEPELRTATAPLRDPNRQILPRSEGADSPQGIDDLLPFCRSQIDRLRLTLSASRAALGQGRRNCPYLHGEGWIDGKPVPPLRRELGRIEEETVRPAFALAPLHGRPEAVTDLGVGMDIGEVRADDAPAVRRRPVAACVAGIALGRDRLDRSVPVDISAVRGRRTGGAHGYVALGQERAPFAGAAYRRTADVKRGVPVRRHRPLMKRARNAEVGLPLPSHPAARDLRLIRVTGLSLHPHDEQVLDFLDLYLGEAAYPRRTMTNRTDYAHHHLHPRQQVYQLRDSAGQYPLIIFICDSSIRRLSNRSIDEHRTRTLAPAIINSSF